MRTSELKKELVSLIENTNDEALLTLLKEDFVFYGNIKNTDITDGLNDEQLQELKSLSEEESTKDTQTLEEFKKATQQWRTK
jgi:DNA topoisomerase VI subunit B